MEKCGVAIERIINMSMSTMTPDGEQKIPAGWAGQIDSALSLESRRPLENRTVTEALQAIDHDMEYLENLRSSLTGYGMSKICPTDLTDATTDGGMVLGAREKNPSIKGTLAEKMGNLKKNLKTRTITGSEDAKPWVAIKENWEQMDSGMFFLEIICGTYDAAIIYKINDSLGSGVIFGYAGFRHVEFSGGKWRLISLSREGAKEF